MAEVYTCDSSLIRKLDQLCQISKEITETKRDEHSRTYTFPKKWVKVRMPRVLSDEKRAEMAAMARERFGHK